MKLHNLLRWTKRDPSRAARDLRMAGIAKDRALIRATCDDMRARMGLPAAENLYGNPARDNILYRDELHAKAMERGSERLLLAVEGYFIAKAHKREWNRCG